MLTICSTTQEPFDWNLLFNAVTALCTLGALILGTVIAINISFKRDLRRKQLDTVFELVSELQELQLYFSYIIDNPPEGGVAQSYGGDIWFHFFDITQEKFNAQEEFQKSQPEIFVSEKFLYKNPIFKYVQNPFLPQSIALKLINLYPRGGNQSTYNNTRNQVFISDDREYATHTYRKEVSKHYSSVKMIFESADALNISIRTWLKENGADGLNFRDRPINLENYP